MYLYTVETALLQCLLELDVAVDGHAVDHFRPFIVLIGVAAALVADEERSARFENPEHLSEAAREPRPEIDRLERRDKVELRPLEAKLRHIALLHRAAAAGDRALVELPRPLDADIGVVNAVHDALRAFFQQRFYVRTAAAAAVEHLRVGRDAQKLQPPARKGAGGRCSSSSP